jgi:hypothetical protein
MTVPLANELWARIIRHVDPDPYTWRRMRRVSRGFQELTEKICYTPLTGIHIEADIIEPPEEEDWEPEKRTKHYTTLTLFYSTNKVWSQDVEHTEALKLLQGLWIPGTRLNDLLLRGQVSENEKNTEYHFNSQRFNPFSQCVLKIVDLERRDPRKISIFTYLPLATPKEINGLAPSFFGIRLYEAFAFLLKTYVPYLEMLTIRDQAEWIEQWAPLLEKAQLSSFTAYMGPKVNYRPHSDAPTGVPLYLLWPILHGKKVNLLALELGFRQVDGAEQDWNRFKGFGKLITGLNPVSEFYTDFPATPKWTEKLWDELRQQPVVSPFQKGLKRLMLGPGTHLEKVSWHLMAAFPNLNTLGGVDFQEELVTSVIQTLCSPFFRSKGLEFTINCFPIRINNPFYTLALQKFEDEMRRPDPEELRFTLGYQWELEQLTTLSIFIPGPITKNITIVVPTYS